jgi:non-specific serine/threonine protein kinase
MERWLQRLQPELDNFRMALMWFVVHEPAAAVRLAGALGEYWDHANLYAEGRQWMQRALAVAPAAPLDLRARALLWAGWLAHQLGDFARAELDLTEAVTQARALDDIPLLGGALYHLCTVLLSQGEPERAQPISDEVLALARLTGNPFYIAIATFNAGCVALAKGDPARAEVHLAESLELLQGSNMSHAVASAQGWLGRAVLARGDHPRAATLLREAIKGFAAANDWAVLAELLEYLAGATVASEPTATVRVLGAASQLRTRFGHPRKPSDAAEYDQTLVIARATLGDVAFTEAWNAGQLLSQDEALAVAVALADVTASTPAAAPRPQLA